MNIRRVGAWTATVAVATGIAASSCSSKSAEVDTSRTVELIASLKQRSLPGLPDPLTPEKAIEIEKWRTGPGGWFVEKGCFACHDVSVYGIKNAAPVGPDLALAVEDVQARFGMPVEEFFKAPVGTMTIVLSQMIVLSPEEKAVAIEKLKEANRAYKNAKKEKDGGRSGS